MSRTASSISVLMAAMLPTLASRSTQAKAAAPNEPAAEARTYAAPPADQAEPAPQPESDILAAGMEQQGAEQEGPSPPIPPFVDTPPVQAAGGGYCYVGPHPVDSRVEPGVTWDNTPGRHIHPYPPFDLRLFSFKDGCYYFIGDPSDFGYAQDTYSYYGAHPIAAIHGGGWCFMIGPHRHLWRPWSPFFVTVGPWYYWQGPYDPFFWTYWPFYHFYYRHHYPRYYAHGAFFRGHVVAPRITTVPRPMRPGPAWHGAGRGAFRAAPMAPRGPGAGPGTFRAAPATPRGTGPASGTFRAAPMTPRGPGPGPGTFRAAPSSPGPGPGTFRAAPVMPRGGSFAPGGGFAPRGFSAPAPGVRGGRR